MRALDRMIEEMLPYKTLAFIMNPKDCIEVLNGVTQYKGIKVYLDSDIEKGNVILLNNKFNVTL